MVSFRCEVWGGTGCRRMIHVRFEADKNFLKKNYRRMNLCVVFTLKRDKYL
jgi:hypothetical protein